MKKTRFWVLLIAVIALVSAAAAVWLFYGKTGGTVANVYQDGVCIRSIDLSRLAEPETFTVSGPAGTNTIVAEPGRIRVSHADCPDQVCVDMGWRSDGAVPIVCLPNKLVIRIERAAPAADAVDGVTG